MASDEFSALRKSADGIKVKLVDYLPGHLKNSQTGEFLQFFEDFLNELYYNEISDRGKNKKFDIVDGEKAFFTFATTSAGDVILNSAGLPTKIPEAKVDRISILEKAKRIMDLHDPNLIDIEFIQRLANFMGYDVNIHRGQINNLQTTSADSDDLEETDETQKYLRFVVQNLPNWYKIKSTRNAVKVLLYSLGIVGDIVYRWTSDDIRATSAHPQSGGYGNDQSLWTEEEPVIPTSAAAANIPSNFFPTPHFVIRIDQIQTPASWYEDLNQIIDALEIIRPVNNVLDSINVVFNDLLDDGGLKVRNDEYVLTKMVFDFNPVVPLFVAPAQDLIIETGSALTTFIETGSASDQIIETL